MDWIKLALILAVVAVVETVVVMWLFGLLHQAEPAVPAFGFWGSALVVMIGQIITYKPSND